MAIGGELFKPTGIGIELEPQLMSNKGQKWIWNEKSGEKVTQNEGLSPFLT